MVAHHIVPPIIQEHAKAIAGRVDANAVGLDPITILTIITQVLPLVISCWNRNDEPNPQLSAVNFQRYYNAHPEQALRRTARRVRAEADAPMTKEQSFAFAKAIIDQALNTDDATVTACCQSCMGMAA